MLFMLSTGCKEVAKTDENNLSQILSRGVLKVGTVYGLSTFYHDADDATGFEYELLKGFADKLGVRLEVYPYYTLAEMQAQVAEGHITIAAAGVPIRYSQLTELDIGPIYRQVSQKLVFKQGNPRPRTWTDIEHPITVVAGSGLDEQINTLKSVYPNLAWEETHELDKEEVLGAIKRGEIRYTITDSDTLATVRRRHPEVSVGFTTKESADIAWLLPKSIDDSVHHQLFEYFALIEKDGSLEQLKEKYFGHTKLFNYVDTRAFIKAAQVKLPTYIEWFKTHSLNLDWRLVAALSYQESHWEPKAKSPTGVRGIMMLTQNTAKDWGVTSRLDPEQNIIAGAKYLSSLMRRLPKRIEHPDRLWFALAAYNIGMGHLEDARVLTQRQGGNPDLWLDVKQRLPLLRQKHYYKKTKYGYARGDEATIYVSNIRRYYDTLSYLYSEQSVLQKIELTEQINPVPATDNKSIKVLEGEQ